MKLVNKWSWTSQLIAVLLCSAAIKLHYSTASVNGLLWILAPTKFLVSLTTGVRFTFESYAGYMSSDRSFIIAGACSGVNFLIAAFLMLSLAKLWRCRSQSVSWRFIPLFLAVAYVATIGANTVRIAIALFIRRADPELIWLNHDQLHRFEGIAVYFGFLLLLFILSEKIASGSEGPPVSVFGLLKRSLLPLSIYYATTLGVPLANGAYRRGPEFWEHFIFVLLTPVVLVGILAGIALLKRWTPGRFSHKIDDPVMVGQSEPGAIANGFRVG